MGGQARLLDRKNLLDDYVLRMQERKLAVENSALRTESLGMREVLAHGASHGACDFETLCRIVAEQREFEYDHEWLASLARVCALQNIRSDDHTFALEALSIATSKLKVDAKFRRFRKLEVELLVGLGFHERARDLLDRQPDLKKIFFSYLKTDLFNPYSTSPIAEPAQWAEHFSKPFRARELADVSLREGAEAPFDRLSAPTVEPGTERGPLISVIMTAYNPAREAFSSSIDSILTQSWHDLEVIVVDDGSDADHGAFLERFEQKDSRVRYHRLDRNQGTYVARNAGLALATGTYVTGQDADDWSHPSRIEHQVKHLEANGDLAGVRVYAISTDENLLRTRLGYNPFNPNASSLMVRRDLAVEIGGYLATRRAADNEFHHRLVRYSGSEIEDIKKPLTLVRVLPESLSRGDFRAGWSHPARRAFRGSYTRWHREAEKNQMILRNGHAEGVVIPKRFAVEVSQRGALDVVLAGDWRQWGGPQISMMEEIAALISSGFSVGILHLEAARFMAAEAGSLCEPIQQLINRGVVEQLFHDESWDIDLLVVRYPPTLQFVPHLPSSLTVSRLIILANQAPSERDGADIRYLIEDCTENARSFFGCSPLWVPQGPVVRQAIVETQAAVELADFDIPGILDPGAWRTERSSFRSVRPVVGRHSRDNAMKWPEDPAVFREIYRDDGSADVRIMGGGRVPMGILDCDTPPPGWLILKANELPVRTFLNSIDFFVYYQHSQAYDAFGRATLEALAAGCVAILPPELEVTFGDAGVYVEPAGVQDAIRRYYEDIELFAKQARRAMEVVKERFSYDCYVQLINRILRIPASEW